MSAGIFARNGLDVTLIDPWPEHIETIRAKGLELDGMTAEERFTVTTAKTMHLTEVQNLSKQKPIDIAFVSVKSYDTEWATMMIRQYLAPDGYIVSLQNCLNEERIAGIVGWGKTVGCIAARIAVDLHAPGRVRRTVAKGGSAHTVVPRRRGAWPRRRSASRRSPRCSPASTASRSRPISGASAGRSSASTACATASPPRPACPATSGDRNDRIRRFAIHLGGEAVRIGQALGYELEHIGNLDPDRLALAQKATEAALEEVEAVMIAGTNTSPRSDLQRPSMGQDMLKGRRTEIDYLNGFIVEKGQEIGRPAPSHAKLTEMVKRVERGEIPARPENVAAL